LTRSGYYERLNRPGLPEAVLFESRRDGGLFGSRIIARFGFGRFGGQKFLPEMLPRYAGCIGSVRSADSIR